MVVGLGSLVVLLAQASSTFLLERSSPRSRYVVAQDPPNLGVKRFSASDRYCCFDLPAVVSQLFGSFRSLFRGNIDEEKSLPLVAIQPG